MSKKEIIKVKLDIEVRDKDGKIIQKHSQKSHSFLLNFLKALRNLFDVYVGTQVTGTYYTANGVESITDPSGLANTQTIIGNTTPIMVLGVKASSGDATFGIQIGSGTNPVSINDYNLQSRYGNDVFTRGDTQFGAIQVSGNSASFTISRDFTNVTSSYQNIYEVGIEAYINGIPAFILRDILSSPVSVPPNGVVKVTYTIGIQA